MKSLAFIPSAGGSHGSGLSRGVIRSGSSFGRLWWLLHADWAEESRGGDHREMSSAAQQDTVVASGARAQGRPWGSFAPAGEAESCKANLGGTPKWDLCV